MLIFIYPVGVTVTMVRITRCVLWVDKNTPSSMHSAFWLTRLISAAAVPISLMFQLILLLKHRHRVDDPAFTGMFGFLFTEYRTVWWEPVRDTLLPPRSIATSSLPVPCAFFLAWYAVHSKL